MRFVWAQEGSGGELISIAPSTLTSGVASCASARAGDTSNRKTIKETTTVGTKGNESKDDDSAREVREIEIVYGHFFSLLPNQTKVNREPGKGATRAIKRALKERPVNVLIDAINGAKAMDNPNASRFRIESIFGTWKGTGSLAERIDWLASRAPHRTWMTDVTIPQSILDRVGVRERLQDARREIRAAFDSDNTIVRYRAIVAERWLAEQGLVIVLGGLNERGAQAFEIGAGEHIAGKGIFGGL
jgi:hypothetical protein